MKGDDGNPLLLAEPVATRFKIQILINADFN